MTKADVLVVSKLTTLLLDDAEAFIIRLVVAPLDWFLLLLFSRTVSKSASSRSSRQAGLGPEAMVFMWVYHVPKTEFGTHAFHCPV
jgi:hypothetical protein